MPGSKIEKLGELIDNHFRARGVQEDVAFWAARLEPPCRHLGRDWRYGAEDGRSTAPRRSGDVFPTHHKNLGTVVSPQMLNLKGGAHALPSSSKENVILRCITALAAFALTTSVVCVG